MTESKRYFYLLIALLSSLVRGSNAQDVCSCAPSTYRFTFDFSSVCSEDVTSGGIASTYCTVEPFGDTGATDFVPVSDLVGAGLLA